MACSLLPGLLILCLIFVCTPSVRSQVQESGLQLMTDAMDWPSSSSMSLLDADFEAEDGEDSEIGRRSLWWKAVRHYYISYGALSANRIPCPARSGRSYYTNNCHKVRGPPRPYTRGCSRITRCRR